jgi:secreted trypsin-like serine protease
MLRCMLFKYFFMSVVLSVIALPAVAITGNYVKDFEHPFVGLAVFYDASGEFLHRCSGSLLTSTLFLTAGHCIDGATLARVYFQQDAGVRYDAVTQMDPVTGYPNTCLTSPCATGTKLYNYGFNDFQGFPNTKDLGIVILDQPIILSEYGVLAPAGSLDVLATRRGLQQVTFTASGYGLTESNPVRVTSFRERLMATGSLVNLKSALTDGFNLQTIGAGNGRGGTCSGDSGGPIFYGPSTSNTIVGVTSFGLNPYCKGVDFAFRTDTEAVIAWILSVAQTNSAGTVVIPSEI